MFPVEVTPKGVRHLRRAVSIDRSSLTGLTTEILAHEYQRERDGFLEDSKTAATHVLCSLNRFSPVCASEHYLSFLCFSLCFSWS